MTYLFSIKEAYISSIKQTYAREGGGGGGGGGRIFPPELIPLPRAQEKISPVRGTLTSDIIASYIIASFGTRASYGLAVRSHILVLQ